jgi:cellulose synthase/poly-beta-1,6-N-acetylglucosamine synthase-like glycosyltransferase
VNPTLANVAQMNIATTSFWIAFGVVAYAYAGYPLMQWLWAVLRPRRHLVVPRSRLSVSIVVAARNEDGVVRRRVLELTDALRRERLSGELILVSDGSTDRTADLARSCSNDDVPVTVIELPGSVGKSAALTQGCQAARHDVIVLADARQVWAPDALPLLLQNFADPQVGAVGGELELAQATGVVGGIGLYWRYERWIRQNQSLVGSTVGVSGSICAVRRELFAPIPQGTLLDDVYWPMRVVMEGHRVVRDPRAKAFDSLPVEPRAEFRRKVRTLSGNFQLLSRMPSLLLPWRNPLWVQFFSHKLMRLVAPWAMLVMLGSSLLHGGDVWRIVFAAQVLFYGVGVAAGLGPRGPFRVASPVASFLLLNAAAWTAFWVWLTGRAARSWTQTSYRVAPAGSAGPQSLPLSPT